MQKINISLPEIKLVGIKVRTKTTAECDPSTAKIAPMVQEYFQNAVAEKISSRKERGRVFIAYSEYESDYKGEYTCFIGEEVTSIDNVAEGLEIHIIEPQNYLKFTTESGPMPKIVIDAWQKIWQLEDKELSGKRRYKTDFEIYDQRALDPENTALDIYIGIN